jgi:hypothetical protein
MVQIIQEYRNIVNVMASLLLRIDEEGMNSEIADQLATSGRQSVSSQLHLVAYFTATMPDNTVCHAYGCRTPSSAQIDCRVHYIPSSGRAVMH